MFRFGNEFDDRGNGGVTTGGQHGATTFNGERQQFWALKVATGRQDEADEKRLISDEGSRNR